MKSLRKILSLVLCVTLMLGIFSVSASADALERFYAEHVVTDMGTYFRITTTLTSIWDDESLEENIDYLQPFLRVTCDGEHMGDYSFSSLFTGADSVSQTLLFTESGHYEWQVFTLGWGFEVEDGYTLAPDGNRYLSYGSYTFKNYNDTVPEYPFVGSVSLDGSKISVRISGAGEESNAELSALLNSYAPYATIMMVNESGAGLVSNLSFTSCSNGVSEVSDDISGFEYVLVFVSSENMPELGFVAWLSYQSENGDYYESDMIEVFLGTPAPPIVFDDVNDAWYAEYVYFAVGMGLINGYGNGLFGPEDNLSYAHALTLACKIHYLTHNFEDPAAYFDTTGYAPWYQLYIDYAKANGIPWNFKNYDANISRAEYVRVFYSALPDYLKDVINSVANGSIPDVPMTAPYANEIYSFYRMGILNGSDALGTFFPNNPIRRSEVAAIVCRMVDPSFRKLVDLG